MRQTISKITCVLGLKNMSLENLNEAPKSTRNEPVVALKVQQSRLNWVDYAKGTAIVLVALGHVLIGTYNAKLDLSYPLYIYCLKLIYSFHMPAFFFLSGMFANRERTKSLNKIFAKKLETIVYPYIVWSIIQGIAYALMSPYTNFKYSIAEIPFSIAFDPLIQFWFLYILFIYHILFAFLDKVLKPFYPILLAFSSSMYLVSFYVDAPLLSKMLKFFIFYVLGASLAKTLLENKWLFVDGKRIFIVSLLFIYLQSIFLQFDGRIDIVSNPIQSFFMACAGITFVIFTSVYFSKRNILNPIRQLGILSMPIYLMHILAAVGARIVLQKVFHINSSVVHIFIGTVLAIALPSVVYIAMQRVHFPYLFSPKNR